MNRKNFLSSTITLLAASSVSGKSVNESMTMLSDEENFCTTPAFLKAGDTIGITSPAGFISLEDIQPAIDKLNEWGFQVKIGSTIGKKDFTFGGTDEERKNDFQEMLDDKNIKAILCARGGYGIVRIIDKLDFKKFKAFPKWIIGFSDVTILHSHINRNFSIGSIHSKMCNSFLKDWSLADADQLKSIQTIYDCLSGKDLRYVVTPNSNNRIGEAKGELVGGNLRVIENLCGSSSELGTKHKILFLEDTEEYLYNIDRMLWNLKRNGKLDHLKGLIIGGFKIKSDNPGEEFGLSLEQIVLEKVKEFNFPVCFNFPVGHQKHNEALICGAKYELTVDAENVNLTLMR
jgi:muramoyltetrapeptide carboxypeptidase